MVEFEPSSKLDDLLGLAVPSTPSTPVAQYRSRRELREAEAARRAGQAPSIGEPSAPVGIAAAPAAETVAAEPPAPVGTPVEHMPAVGAAEPPLTRRAARTAASEPVVGRERARVASAPVAQHRPKPAHRRKARTTLKALVTMTAVGGMFAVAGLPAYASLSQLGEGEPAVVHAAGETVQSITLASTAVGAAASRDGFDATTPEELARQTKDALRAANNAAYLLSGARELGDDYPWFYELSSDQGGGLSPLNYYYRECVDFVAWRLNRDAGYTKAPFKWVWSNLTPTGGDGSQWRYAWEAKGWPVSDVPIAGSVAVIGYNHVAYVKQVNADGTVLLEEYNYNYSHVYGQRTVPASAASAYLYPPS